ncbi:unnamed protein product, partial [Sphagnum troendelagicum]
MEPRAFVRLAVGGLGLRIPVASKASRGGVHAASTPCFCEIRLPNFPVQKVPISLFAPTETVDPDTINNTAAAAASFYLDEPALEKLLLPSCAPRTGRSLPCLEVVVFTGRQKLGTFRLPVGSEWVEGKPLLLHNGWICIGKEKAKGGKPGAELHVSVKVEADPRYLFQFDGETALGPQIVQVRGNTKQPIFSCKFSRDRCSRSRVGQSDSSSGSGWAGSSTGEKDKGRKERKGWLVMIHDLSGSPVAAASMVTPFVPSAGSDYVSRSNPGAWLILRPEPTGMDSWRPWGRLEAWRERGGKSVGCRFQLIAEGGGVAGVASGILMSETVLSAQKGGEFSIDTGRFRPEVSPAISPVDSPRKDSPVSSNGEFSFNMGLPVVGGFVMSCAIRGDRKSSKPLVQLAMRHVACVEDAAVFMALAAAVDLSVDACQPFNRKLRKELSQS